MTWLENLCLYFPPKSEVQLARQFVICRRRVKTRNYFRIYTIITLHRACLTENTDYAHFKIEAFLEELLLRVCALSTFFFNVFMLQRFPVLCILMHWYWFIPQEENFFMKSNRTHSYLYILPVSVNFIFGIKLCSARSNTIQVHNNQYHYVLMKRLIYSIFTFLSIKTSKIILLLQRQLSREIKQTIIHSWMKIISRLLL